MSSNRPLRTAVFFSRCFGIKGTDFQTSGPTRYSPFREFLNREGVTCCQDVFEVKVSSIRPIRRYCSGFADRGCTEGPGRFAAGAIILCLSVEPPPLERCCEAMRQGTVLKG